ncbi:MAG: peptidoglycan DD-metalloendopeptidase family protein [Pseudomonadota bacterium]
MRLAAFAAMVCLAAAGCDGEYSGPGEDILEEDAVEGDPATDDVLVTDPDAADLPADQPSDEDTAGDPPDDIAEEEEEPEDECGWVKIVDLGGETLNVRDEPATSSTVIGHMSEGALAEVLGEAVGDTVTDPDLGRSSDLWYNIRYGGGDGWITSIYAECYEEPDPTEALDWVWPVTGEESLAPFVITCDFGCSWSTYRGHLAEDYAYSDDIGRPVYAAADGIVAHVYRNIGNYKDIIIIRHQLPAATSAGDEVLYSRYGHMGTEVGEGDVVTAGQRIATIVDPVDFGPHLHFEIVNESAQYNGPFCRGCEASGIFMGPGYAGNDFDGSGIDYFDPTGDGVEGNRFYNPSNVINSDGRL